MEGDVWSCGDAVTGLVWSLEHWKMPGRTTGGDASPEGRKDRFSVLTPRAYQRGPGSVKSGRNCLFSVTSLLEAEADGRRGDVTKNSTGSS